MESTHRSADLSILEILGYKTEVSPHRDLIWIPLPMDEEKGRLARTVTLWLAFCRCSVGNPILAQGLLLVPRSLQVGMGTVSHSNPRPLPSTSFKIKRKLSLCLINYVPHAIKTFEGVETLHLSTRWRRMVSCTNRPLCHQGSGPSPVTTRQRGWMGPRTGLDAVEKRPMSCPWRESNSSVA
jgi:hypothetical protein